MTFDHLTLRDVQLYRRLIAVAGVVYLLWWFAVEYALPGSFNPLAGRLAVVAFLLGSLALSFLSELVRSRLRFLFVVGVWLITAHYYFLFFKNSGDFNWVIGAFITVMAICFCFFSNGVLLAYSVYVMLLSFAVVGFLPHFSHYVFLPGLFTILIQANVGLRTRHRALNVADESQHRFELLFNSTFEGILVHREGTILNANDSLLRLLGYEKSEIVGRSVVEIVDRSQAEAVRHQMKVLNSPSYETLARRRDGTTLEIEVRAKDFIYEDRPSRLVAVRDISDRIRAEKQRIEALTMQENIRVRDDFISIASHELKTPISALKLQSQLIERDLRRKPNESFSPETVREFIDVFSRQLSRLTELVETMLDVSRIAGNRLTMEFEEVDLTDLVRETVALAAGPLEFAHGAAVRVRADRSRLRQVVENLLSNSVKYGDGKPVHVTVTREGSHAILSVADQGLGIAPEAIDRIFNRFERAVSSRNISGLGLGLYIAKQIIDAHGGVITVESQLGHGSTFTVHLPLLQ